MGHIALDILDKLETYHTLNTLDKLLSNLGHIGNIGIIGRIEHIRPNLLQLNLKHFAGRPLRLRVPGGDPAHGGDLPALPRRQPAPQHRVHRVLRPAAALKTERDTGYWPGRHTRQATEEDLPLYIRGSG